MSTCSHCGFGEQVVVGETEFYTEGYFYVCDCGYSTIKNKLSYEQWLERVENILSQRRFLLNRLIEIPPQISKLSDKIGDAFVKRGNERLSADGKDWKHIAPKSQERRTGLRREEESLESQEEKLWNEYYHLRNTHPFYAWKLDNCLPYLAQGYA